MLRTACALLCVTLLLSFCSPGLLGRTHSYPKSHGFSGTGHKQSSSFGRRSGSPGGTGHIYPPTNPGSLSGTGTRHHPTPSSVSKQHVYPPSNGHSGNNNHHVTTTTVHHHHHYNPPQRNIYYVSRGGPSYSYPVYRSQPPPYVYQYRDSSSKYGTLLTGLALLNLGMLTASTYSNFKGQHYHSPPGEVCKLVIRRQNGDYEETKIKCELISSFIWAEENKVTQAANSGKTSTNSVTTTINNTTITVSNNGSPATNVTSASATPLYTLLPNGTLVQVNATSMDNPAALNGTGTGNVTTSSVTTVTTTNTTVTEALDPKNNGPPVKVTDGMHCYVTRHSPNGNSRYTVPCGLLQAYASKSFTNDASRNVPLMGIFTALMVAFIIN